MLSSKPIYKCSNSNSDTAGLVYRNLQDLYLHETLSASSLYIYCTTATRDESNI